MKCSVSDNELFDSLSGRLDPAQSHRVQAHLSECDECSLVASLVQQVKTDSGRSWSSGQASKADATQEERSLHPSIGELADFFHETARAANQQEMAAHVAACEECADLLSQHARAAAIARDYEPGEHVTTMPEAAWKLIREWEESSFAGIRPLEDRHSSEMLTRMLRLFNERQVEIREAVSLKAEGREIIPVVIVDGSGSYRRVELFERTSAAGIVRLRHTEGSDRFHTGSLHAIVRTAGGEHTLVSEPIQQDSIQLDRAEASGASRGYFIVED